MSDDVTWKVTDKSASQASLAVRDSYRQNYDRIFGIKKCVVCNKPANTELTFREPFCSLKCAVKVKKFR